MKTVYVGILRADHYHVKLQMLVYLEQKLIMKTVYVGILRANPYHVKLQMLVYLEQTLNTYNFGCWYT